MLVGQMEREPTEVCHELILVAEPYCPSFSQLTNLSIHPRISAALREVEVPYAVYRRVRGVVAPLHTLAYPSSP